MGKKTLYALLLMGLLAILLIANTRGLSPRVDLDLVFTEVKMVKSLVFLGFTALGVVIGVLLK